MGKLAKALEKQYDETLPERLAAIATLLEHNGIKPEEVGKIKSVRITDRNVTKDDGSSTNYFASAITIDPKWKEGPEWPVVAQAAPTVVKPVTSKKASTGDWKTAVILPDPQIGFRKFEDGSLDPFHDEAAMNVALQVVKYLRPDQIVNLGDFLDFAEFGTFEQEAAFAQTTQIALDRGHEFLAQQRACAPEAEIALIEGNHDRRLQKAITRNALSAFGLRRARNAKNPDEWPVLSVPFLLRTEELGVTYVEGYPAGEHWINDNLVCIHGSKVRSGGSTANAVIDDERVSVIFGHVHRIELQHKTRRTRSGAKRNFSATPGCLARVDGAVPSTKGSTDCKGRPVATWENWQQGIGVVRYQEGDGRFNLEIVPIQDGQIIFRDKEFVAQ